MFCRKTKKNEDIKLCKICGIMEHELTSNGDSDPNALICRVCNTIHTSTGETKASFLEREEFEKIERARKITAGYKNDAIVNANKWCPNCGGKSVRYIAGKRTCSNCGTLY